MPTIAEQYATRLRDIQTQARKIAETEDRDETSEKLLTDLLTEGKDLKARAEQYATIDTLADLPQPRAAAETDKLSIGERFVRSESYKGYSGRGTSEPFALERALPMSLGMFGGLGEPQTPKDHITLPNVYGPAPLLDLIPSVQVSNNAVEIVTWAKIAGGAAIVAEGELKPPAEWAPAASTITLDTIAVYTQLTRQLMEDAPAVRSLIDGELRREVVVKMESEAAAGLASATLPTATGGDLLSAIRVGIGTVQAAGYQPNVVLLNPADWATLDLTVLGATLLGPSAGSQFWGLRPVASVSQPAGTATVGDFTAGSARYTRTGVNLYITDSHADTFLKNVFTLLAEARAKTVVTRPAAFCECTAAAAAARTK